MTILIQAIGWYCIVSGIILGAALWIVSDNNKSDEWKLRRAVAWLSHIGFLLAGSNILMR